MVVTIVVLLILAGITITYILGDNSIFKLAQDAKNKTNEALENEQKDMKNITDWIDNYDKQKIFTFQIEYEDTYLKYQCEEGMTWRTWYASKYCPRAEEKYGAGFWMWDSDITYHPVAYSTTYYLAVNGSSNGYLDEVIKKEGSYLLYRAPD